MIGPEVPAHILQNANAASPDEEATSSNDEQSSIGPKIPEDLHTEERGDPDKQQPQVGPQIPPDLLQQQSKGEQQGEQEDNEAEEEEEDYTPALPPELLAQRSRQPASESKSPSQEPQPRPSSSVSAPVPGPLRRAIGPSFPSHPSYHHLDEDSDDDDVGPKPLPSRLQPMHDKDAVTEFIEREERRRKNEEAAKEPKALKRDEWMLVPPSASDLLGKLDTTKMKPRQFARTSRPVDKVENNLWTETPAERQQRIADEVAGKKRRAVDVANEAALGADPTDRKRRRREEEERIRKGVDEYTQKLRGPSLVEQHSRKKVEEEDEPSKAIWDHGRDMSLGGRLMDDDKRKQMIRDSKGLGDRFGSGKGGSFL